METVTAPKDRIYKRESNHCLEIEISSHRRELLEKWMYKKYRPLKGISDSSPSISDGTTQGNCHLKIEAVSAGSSNTKNFSVGQKNGVSTTERSSSGTRRSSLLLGVGFSGYIQVNEERVELTCQRVSGNGYRIAINLQGPDQGVGTALEVRKGQRINIGSVVNDLNQRRKTLGIPKGIEVEKTTGKETKDYFLIAE